MVPLYVEQLDKLYLVDNSPQKPEAIIAQLTTNPKIVYVSMHGNQGIAAALNKALDLAIADGFDWLLTMDQDSQFTENGFADYVSQLPRVLAQEQHVYGLCVTTLDDKERWPTFSQTASCITSGMILNTDFARKAGGFRTDFFIDEVDLEFCYRCNRLCGTLIRYGRPIMHHQLGDSFHPRLLGHTFGTMNEKYLRWYYIMRNRLYVMQAYPEVRLSYGIATLKALIKIVLFEPDKYRKLRYACRGLCDFLRGKKGGLPAC